VQTLNEVRELRKISENVKRVVESLEECTNCKRISECYKHSNGAWFCGTCIKGLATTPKEPLIEESPVWGEHLRNSGSWRLTTWAKGGTFLCHKCQGLYVAKEGEMAFLINEKFTCRGCFYK
jgi:ribosomal protein L37AE/L43A